MKFISSILFLVNFCLSVSALPITYGGSDLACDSGNDEYELILFHGNQDWVGQSVTVNGGKKVTDGTTLTVGAIVVANKMIPTAMVFWTI